LASYEIASANRWREKANLDTLHYNVRQSAFYTVIGKCAGSGKWKRMVTAALLIGACGVGVFTVHAQQNKKKPATAPSKSAPVAAPTPVPFRAGESLEYSGDWLKISGTVTARLSVIEQRSFYGHEAWHFQTQLHTGNPLRYIFPIDDQFDSYSAADGFRGFQFEMYLHEMGKTETDKLRLSTGVEETPGAETVVKVLPGTRDPIGFLYYLRTVDWQKMSEVHGPVYDGHKLYDVRASVTMPRSEITVAAGKFTATGIGAHVFDNGVELMNSKIILWIAQDAAHTPILVTVDLPIGTGRIELLRVAGGK
jgi:Protein of unknown function (DUF3108)